MTPSFGITRKSVSFILPVLLALLLVILTQSVWFATNMRLLSIAIIIDLVFVIPFIYALLIVKQNIPKITILPFFIIGIILSSFIIPSSHQSLLHWVKTWLLPLVELGVIGFIVFNVRRIYITYQHNKVTSFDFYTVLKASCIHVLPSRVATIFAVEMATIYYGLLLWKKSPSFPHSYTYHKNNGLIAILSVILFLMIVETFIFHLLLALWNPVVAWVVSGLSIYSGLQLLGIMKSIKQRPVLIENRHLLLRVGIMADAVIPLEWIEQVEISTKDITNKRVKTFSKITDLTGGHNVVLHLKNDYSFEGLYGLKSKARGLAIYIDDPDKFASHLREAIRLA